MRTHRRSLAALLAGVLGALPALAAPVAHADGDPASDVLLGQAVFYPYSPPVTAALQSQLNGLTARAAAAGFPLKIAVIDSPIDLGVVPDLFGKPQSYAKFLDQEISFQRAEPLLVVMPSGYGMAGLPARTAGAVATLTRPAGKTSDALVRAALVAVPRLSAAAGHPLGATPPPAGRAPGGGGSPVLVVVLAGLAALCALAFGVVTIRGRRRTPPAGPPEEDPATPAER